MEAPYVDPDVIERLQEIRPELELRWERFERASDGGFDVEGNPLPPRWEWRFRLWQRETPDAPEHPIMWIRFNDDSFRHPGEWLVDVVRMQSRMLERAQDNPLLLVQMIEEEEALRQNVADADWDTYCEDVANSLADYLGKLSAPGADIGARA